MNHELAHGMATPNAAAFPLIPLCPPSLLPWPSSGRLAAARAVDCLHYSHKAQSPHGVPPALLLTLPSPTWLSSSRIPLVPWEYGPAE